MLELLSQRAGDRHRRASRLCRPARPRRGGGRLSARSRSCCRTLLARMITRGARGRLADEDRSPARGEAMRRLCRRADPARWAELRERDRAAASPAPTRSISTASRRCSAPSLRSRARRARSARARRRGDWIALGRRPISAALETIMSADRPYFRHDADLLRQRPAAYRPRLYDGGVRRAGALHAARRAPGQVPDRHRRARPEGRAIGAAPPGMTPQEFTDRVPRRSARWAG